MPADQPRNRTVGCKMTDREYERLSAVAEGDGMHSYFYDAENHLIQVDGFLGNCGSATACYSYDADGRRVSKSSGKLYWYGSGGDILAETDASGNTTAEYIFFGGKRIAMLPAAGNPVYYIEDLLGTSRVLTTNTGVVCYDADFYPYGGERSYTNTCPQNYKFEGKERDTETGNDDFGARYYSNRFGRWLSADWSSVPAPVPYANLSNPQTLNLYAMVSDDPESFADLDGHCCEEALQAGEELWAAPDPVSKAIGGLIIVVAVAGAALSNPDVRESVKDFATSLPPVPADGTPGSWYIQNWPMYANQNTSGSRPGTQPSATQQNQSTPANPNGQFEPSPKHGPEQRGKVSPGPKDGQKALDNSVQVKDTSPRRVGVDKKNGQIVVLDQTSKDKFHGHVRTWGQLSSQQQNALIKAGLVDKKGKII